MHVEKVWLCCAEGRPCIDGYVDVGGLCELPSQEEQTRLLGSQPSEPASSGGGAVAGNGGGSVIVDEA